MASALETIRSHSPLHFVLLIAVLGVFLTIFVPKYFWLSKIGQRIAHATCKNIEAIFPADLRFHTVLSERYEAGKKWKPKVFGQEVGRAQRWVYLLSLLFFGAWLVICCSAVRSKHTGSHQQEALCEIQTR